MPRPFPGMDPYLEERGRWTGLHHRLITYAAESLQPQLRGRYFANIEERVEIASLSRAYVPDVLVVQRQGPERPAGPVATLLADTPTMVRRLEPDRKIPYIEIVHQETDQVVTVIEVLSPSNKSGEGREEYLRKQRDYLASETSLVEVDLLSTGLPTVVARAVAPLPDRDSRYVVSVSRLGLRNELDIYAFGLAERLPRCGIPLRGDDPDVLLDLPAVFSRCYDVAAYVQQIDYAKPPPVALSDADTAWVQALLKDAGLIPA